MACAQVDRIADKEVPEELTHTVDLEYQAGPWNCARRVVLVIEERPLELLPHYFFLVTNASDMSPIAVPLTVLVQPSLEAAPKASPLVGLVWEPFRARDEVATGPEVGRW